MLSAGEFVHNAAAVQHYGTDFMHAVNKKQLRKFSDGGPVTLGSAAGTAGDPGAEADLISAHFAQIEQTQTANIKDAIDSAKGAIVSSVNTVATNITSLQSLMSTSLTAIQTQATAKSTQAAATTKSTGSAVNGGLTIQEQYSLSNQYGSLSQSSSVAGGSGDSFGGSFADGGSFVVGGSGGTDSQHIRIKATPGEIVTISAPGRAKIPGSDDNVATLRPSAPPASMPAMVGRVLPHGDPAFTPDRTARNVNIYVQAGVQADQFIRSRAEIQRSMR
jgi:hypothetical protein